MAPTLVGSRLPPVVSTHPTHLTFLPPAQGSALSSQPVTLSASGRNSTRSRPWEAEMSQRCVCLPWRSGPPSCPSLSLPAYAALPGPATRGNRNWATVLPCLPASFQGPCALPSLVPPTPATVFTVPSSASPAAHTSTLRRLRLHRRLPQGCLSYQQGGVSESGAALQGERSLSCLKMGTRGLM